MLMLLGLWCARKATATTKAKATAKRDLSVVYSLGITGLLSEGPQENGKAKGGATGAERL
jgi:hypothetical protein